MAKSNELKRLHVTAVHAQPIATCTLCAQIEAEDAASAERANEGVIVESHNVICRANDCHGECLDPIMMSSRITLRSALRLEIRTGMRRSNRGRPTTTIANEAMGTNIRSKRKVYEAFNSWLVERGAEDKPL